jgi:hypothetical protein
MKRRSERSPLATGTTRLGLGDVLGGLALSGNVLLGHLGGLLSSDLLGLTLLDFLLVGDDNLVAVFAGLCSASLDLIKGHADDGLADLGGLASVTLLDLFGSDLLVLGAPFLSPSKVDLFDALVEHAASLLGEEVGGLTVLRDKATATSWVNLVCCVGANFSLSNHLSESI